MKNVLVIGIFTLIMAVFLITGCSSSKKTIEIAEPDDQPVAKVEQVEEETPVPVKQKPVIHIDLKDINFDFDKYNLRSDAIAILAEHVRKLRENPTTKMHIEGHCDEWGSAEYNLALGERRAFAVKNYMLKSGITAERITTISYGKERPIDSRNASDAWAKNRRAAFVVKDS